MATLEGLEAAIGDLRRDVSSWREEMIRCYYTKPEIDDRLTPMAPMATQMATLTERIANLPAREPAKKPNSLNGKLNSHTIDRALQVIMFLVILLALILGVELPGIKP